MNNQLNELMLMWKWAEKYPQADLKLLAREFIEIGLCSLCSYLEMSIGKKYNDYLKGFPINIEWRITITKDLEGFTRDNTMYFGPRLGSMKHGAYGICFEKQSNGCLVIREGEWKQDRFDGKGSAYYIPKTVKNEASIIIWKEGEWMEDNLRGKGIIKEYNTMKKKWVTTYVGSFKDGFRHGNGISLFDGHKYQGQFENDYFHGHGRLTKSEDNFYDGQFIHGRPSGKGIQRRNTEVIIYEGNNKQIFSAPEEDLHHFYSTIVNKM